MGGVTGVVAAEKQVIIHRSNSNCRPLLTDAGCLFESMGDLQDSEIIPVASYDLDADRQSVRRKASRN